MRSLCCVALGLLLGACRAAPQQVPDGVLVVLVTPPAPSAPALGLLVYVDDRPLPWPPLQPALKLPLASGAHRVEVRLPGCFTAYREVTVPHGGEAEARVVLRPDPDAAGLSAPGASGP